MGTDLPPEEEVALRAARSRGRAEEWALVLSAEGLAPRVRARDGAFLLLLPAAQLAAASAALDAYERENPPPARPEPEAEAQVRRSQAGSLVAACWVVFFFVTGVRHPGNPWFEAGSADAVRILSGETWRAATALTLHADWGHVIANAIMGAFLLNAVCGALGGGLGLLAALLAGIGGNTINALAQTASHSSVGASTAVFGALGLLCGPAFLRRRRRRGARGRLLAPVAAGLGVIAMLGVGGERTDLWAHLFGFAVGTVLGFPLAAASPRLGGRGVQIACGALALAIVLWSWGTALGL